MLCMYVCIYVCDFNAMKITLFTCALFNTLVVTVDSVFRTLPLSLLN